MNNNLLGTSYYANNKKKIWSFAIFSCLMFSIVLNLTITTTRINDHKEKWIAVYNQNIELLETIESPEDLDSVIVKYNDFVVDTFNKIYDTNDDYELADILHYNRINENKSLLEKLKDDDLDSDTVMANIKANISRSNTIIKTLNTINERTLLEI